MSQKIKRENTYRRSRPRKRNFSGNQFIDSNNNDTAGTSASARKLNSASANDIVVTPTHYYRIIEFVTVFGGIAEMLICRQCKQNVTFEESGHRGLGFKINIKCQCDRISINSGPFINNAFEINRRIVFVFRLLGISREGLNIFCGLMDIGQGMTKTTYINVMEKIHVAASAIFGILCKKAIEEENQENVENERPLSNLKISGDGSWKTRGFSSLFGVTTLIGYYTGKVIDLVVKGSYCQSCTYWKGKNNTEDYLLWYAKHEKECVINHSGSAGKMEVDSMKEMFTRSDEKFGVKYGNYIGDGDTKTFKAILDMKPYGDNFEIIKSECVGHVEKRMGTRLRNVKKTEKLGGKGKLTDVLIQKLTKYYGLAIRRNSKSVDKMEKAIMATFYHLISTDKKPQHHFCPQGADSWCKWRVAEAAGTLQNFEHPPAFHSDVQKHLLPIYQDLSRRDLLERCLGGHTQNANESFNSTIWRLAPKHLNCGLKTIEIAAFIAAGIFNEGYNAILQIMDRLEIVIGQQCKMFTEHYDAQRLQRQKRRSQSRSKEARTARREEKTTLHEFFEEAEGLVYGPGIAD